MNAFRDPVGLLYHGTRRAAATLILEHGFRRSCSRSYTGTGICLSERLSVAYEYGAYETGGCVLEVKLLPTTRWLDGSGRDDLERAASRDAWDEHFAATGLDAVRAYGGNVWVVWQPSVVASLRGLTHREAVRGLCAQFDSDGPDHGYNGVVSDYASLWWRQGDRDPNLSRFPEHRMRLEKNLARLVGRASSGEAARARDCRVSA